MSKAVVLTYAGVTEQEKEILLTTDIFKIALNQHAEDLNPDIRIITDYILRNIYQRFPQKIVSIRDHSREPSDRVIYPADIEFKGSTILAAIDWLIKEGYTAILIVGNNRVNSEVFREEVKSEINKIKHKAKIYQNTNGNFDLPVMSIAEFAEAVIK